MTSLHYFTDLFVELLIRGNFTSVASYLTGLSHIMFDLMFPFAFLASIFLDQVDVVLLKGRLCHKSLLL